MFDNQVFDSWLTKKSDEILSKVDKEKISTEEMLTLILKAQTNHFHHMDEEFRGEFRKIDQRFTAMDESFNKRFDRMTKILMWMTALIMTMMSGLYVSLVF